MVGKTQSSIRQRTDKTQSYPLPTLEELLEAGVHFGHQSRRWHPKIAPYLYKKQGGIHIFDLLKTYQKLQEAGAFLFDLASSGKTVCFVGTKKQASPIVKDLAKGAGAFYMTERWIGGLLTNFDHVKNKMRRLKDLEAGLAEGGHFASYTKRERLALGKHWSKLEKEIGGIRDLEARPDCLYVVDIKREQTAVTEARQVGIKLVALVDSNCDPNLVDYPIPGNDDASRSIEVITRAVAGAVEAGYRVWAKSGLGGSEKVTRSPVVAPVAPVIAAAGTATKPAAKKRGRPRKTADS